LAGTPIIDAQNRAADLGVLRDQFRDNPGIARKFIQGLFEIPHKAWATGEVPSPPDAMLYSLNALSGAFPFAAKGTVGVAGGKPFYSSLRNAVEGSPLTKAPGEQWAGTVRNTPGVKPEELEWTGFQNWLKDRPSTTKQEAIDYLDANEVKLQEVMKGEPKPGSNESAWNRAKEWYEVTVAPGQRFEDLPVNERAGWVGYIKKTEIPDPTKHSQWQMPGGENYRELLLTLPEVRGQGTPGWETGQLFKAGHYDEPNVLAHVRFNDRVDANGKKTLFLEEIQSDWHQKGRKEGYVATEQQKMAASDQIKAIRQQQQDLIRGRAPTEEIQKQWDALDAKAAELGKVASGTGRIPDAPFKTSWPELSLKRMIKYAVDNGYDSVSWTPGKVQAERYDLSKQVDSIYAYRKNDGSFALEGETKRGGRVPISESVPKDKLADYVGKELAEKIAAQERMEHTYTGVDLKMGGEGMTAFYDKMLPAAANKLGKKYGAKVGVTALGGKYRLKELGSGRWAIQADGKFLKDAGGAGRSWATKEEAMAELKHQAAIGNASEDVAQEVWSLPITDAMRKEVGEKGVPLFSGGAPAPQPSDEERAKTLQSLMGNQS
jgi:hypothetical protein